MANGNIKSGRFLSLFHNPISPTITIGYMLILWYQHKTQGGNLRISLKNKLPTVEIIAIAKTRGIAFSLKNFMIYSISLS